MGSAAGGWPLRKVEQKLFASTREFRRSGTDVFGMKGRCIPIKYQSGYKHRQPKPEGHESSGIVPYISRQSNGNRNAAQQ